MATPMPPACAALPPATADERQRVSAAVLSGRAEDGDGLYFYRDAQKRLGILTDNCSSRSNEVPDAPGRPEYLAHSDQ